MLTWSSMLLCVQPSDYMYFVRVLKALLSPLGNLETAVLPESSPTVEAMALLTVQ